MGPFNRDLPRMQMARSIGQGVQFLNRHLSAAMFGGGGGGGGAGGPGAGGGGRGGIAGHHHGGGGSDGKAQLLEFLRSLRHRGAQSLMLNPARIMTLAQLREALLRADKMLDAHDDEAEVMEGAWLRWRWDWGEEKGGGRREGRGVAAGGGDRYPDLISLRPHHPRQQQATTHKTQNTTHSASHCGHNHDAIIIHTVGRVCLGALRPRL